MAGCQNYGPFLGTLNIRGRIIIGIQKGTIILITTHMCMYVGDIELQDHSHNSFTGPARSSLVP